MLEKTEKNILFTVAYYNELNYPLTAFEIWKYLNRFEPTNEFESTNPQKAPLEEIAKLLDSKELRKYIEEFRGFYFLKGKKELVESRMRKNKIAGFKFKKLRKIVRLLRLVPFVRMFAVTGRLAMKNVDRNSDWDFFVVVKKGKIWTGRTLLTLFLQFIGKRRHKNCVKDRVCLNYFVTDESLKIDVSKRPMEINLFSANEYSFMIPLFGFRKFRKFQIRNSWISKLKPNYELQEIKNTGVISDTKFSKAVRKCGEKIVGFDFIENFLRKIEMERIAKNPKTHLLGSLIEANDENLVFLPEPQGVEMYKNVIAKLEIMGLKR